MFGRRSSKVDQTPEAAEKLAKQRSMLQGMILMNGLDRKPFAGAEWPYFFSDLRDEAKAAKVALPDGSVDALASFFDALPAGAVLRLELMKKAADLWSAGHYLRSELDPGLDGADVAWFDGYAADRLRDGRPLAFAIPAPARSFGTRCSQSGYAYHGGGRVGPSFEVWLKNRERSGSCGKNFPACCGDPSRNPSGIQMSNANH